MTPEQRAALTTRIIDLRQAAREVDLLWPKDEPDAVEIDHDWGEVLHTIIGMRLKPVVTLRGDEGRWVRLDQDYQDEVPAGSIGVIIREYETDDANSFAAAAWDVFVSRPGEFGPLSGRIVSVPAGSQEILREVRTDG